MMYNQKGFTLIESLLVLSVFLIISSVTAFSLKPQYMMIDDQSFFTQLKADLFYAQQYAISHQCEVNVIFSETQFKYQVFIRYDLPVLVERNYSKNMTVYGGSLPLYFRFLPSGNASKFGSFFIKTKDKLFRMTILIGEGRFYVVEE